MFLLTSKEFLLQWHKRGGRQFMEERLLTIKDRAQYLHLNEMTVYSYAQKGKIPGIKVGRNWRFKKEDIDRWLEGQKKSSCKC